MRRINGDKREEIKKEDKNNNKRNGEKAYKKARWDKECGRNKKEVRKRLTSWR